MTFEQGTQPLGLKVLAFKVRMVTGSELKEGEVIKKLDNLNSSQSKDHWVWCSRDPLLFLETATPQQSQHPACIFHAEMQVIPIRILELI